MLAEVARCRTAAQVLGGEVAMPVLVAPVAYQRLVDRRARSAMARAAAGAGTVMCLSTLATLQAERGGRRRRRRAGAGSSSTASRTRP